MNGLCADDELQALVAAIEDDSGAELAEVDRLIRDYPDDGRLHFLRGSILASIGRPIEAMPALRRAVELAPDLAIARFQLGFFQLTSGEAANALGSWGPLALLPEDHYLRKFVAGLTHLIRDEFAEAELHLGQGIAANAENPPLNRDMQLLLDQIRVMLAAPADSQRAGDTTSATSFLLDQLANRSVH